MYCATTYHTVLYRARCIVLQRTVLYCTVLRLLCFIAQCCIVLCCIVQWCIVPWYTITCYIVPWCTYCGALHRAALFPHVQAYSQQRITFFLLALCDQHSGAESLEYQNRIPGNFSMKVQIVKVSQQIYDQPHKIISKLNNSYWVI